MKQSEAIAIVRQMLPVCQKIRSNMVDPNYGVVKDLENQDDPMVRIIQSMNPTLTDSRNTFMEFLITVADKCEQQGTIGPQDFYNLMFLAHRDESQMIPDMFRVFN